MSIWCLCSVGFLVRLMMRRFFLLILLVFCFFSISSLYFWLLLLMDLMSILESVVGFLRSFWLFVRLFLFRCFVCMFIFIGFILWSFFIIWILRSSLIVVLVILCWLGWRWLCLCCRSWSWCSFCLICGLLMEFFFWILRFMRVLILRLVIGCCSWWVWFELGREVRSIWCCIFCLLWFDLVFV